MPSQFVGNINDDILLKMESDYHTDQEKSEESSINNSCQENNLNTENLNDTNQESNEQKYAMENDFGKNLDDSRKSLPSSSASSSSIITDSASCCSANPSLLNDHQNEEIKIETNSDLKTNQNNNDNDKSDRLSISTVPPINSSRKSTMVCEMCNNYEIQLQDIQYRESVLNLQIGQSEKTIKQLKEDLKKEQSFRFELEEKYVDESKRFETDIKTLSLQVDHGKSCVEKMTIKFNKLEKRANDLVTDLISQIESLKKEIQRLAIDNEKLLARHLKKSREMSSESISLPEDQESLQFYCLQLRENLIQALYIKEHLEETLRSENMFLKEQLLGEQQSKENIEKSFSDENETLSVKIQSTESELNDMKKQNSEMKTELELVKNNFNHLSLTSSNRIRELDEKVKELTGTKTKFETEISTLRAKVQSLQVDLDNSEQVQRDFVKLSQSLQVQLEKIRQADTEVRWQHEEDVSECNGCKKTFQYKKEKINCCHCGRIFCLECCNKVIRSGPKMRPNKVCQVCHTLLDNQTACWFVNEAPQNPA